jgi:hypothetical protein
MAFQMLVWSAARVDAVPAAPANLTATVSGDIIFLVWAAPPTAILGYRLEAGFTPGSTIAFRTLAPTPGPVSGFTATPIPPGTYYLRIYAFDATGVSAPSNEVVAVVNGASCAAAPAPPTNLTANVIGTSVTLIWTPGSGGCPPTSYILQAGSAPGASNLAVLTLPAAVLGATAPPGVYYVRVLAQNGALVSAPSTEIVVTVGGAAPPPR